MATVCFSNKLIQEIEQAARDKMNFAVDKARKTKPDNAWSQRIYDILFYEHKPIISQVPAGWLKMVDKLEITSVNNRSCNITFDFTTPQPFPYTFNESELAKKSYHYGDSIALKMHPVWDEFAGEVSAYKLRVQEAINRRDDFVDSVRKICTTYSTLAPALKAWPPLWDLLPEHVKDKHREVKKREKKEVVLDVDVDKLTSISTAAKFGL